MNIDGVKNGIVLDHIKAGKSMRIYQLLGLDKLDCCVAIIQNVNSSKYGKKDIIKIDTDIEVDLEALGYIDSHITVNYVKDGKLSKKLHLTLPDTLTGIIRDLSKLTGKEVSLEKEEKIINMILNDKVPTKVDNFFK